MLPKNSTLHSDGGISDFQISSQSLIKGNCHNSGTIDDIDIKLGPVTKLGVLQLLVNEAVMS